MATYKEIKGVTIQTNTKDPVIGGVAGGTWAAGGDLLAATSGMAAFGTQTAALSVGGYLGPPGATAKNEEYNGTSFTEKADIAVARYGLRGAGTTTAGFVAGGPAPNNNLVESWNGSSWTETTEMASGKENGAACGTQTAFLIFGGVPPATGDVNTFYRNGSSWAEGGDMNQAKRNLAGFGVYNGAIAAGGETPSVTNNTESYNGTAWTEVNEMNTARRALAGSGSNTAGLVYGGTTGSDSANTESWNGTTWTEVADLATGRLALGGAGTTNASAFAIGGEDPVQAGTEEFSTAGPTDTILTEGDLFLSAGTTLKGFGKFGGIPTGTWASGGSLNSTHGYGTGFGVQNAAVSCFGSVSTTPNASTNTELYNGTTWTEVNEGNTARRNMGSAGLQTSGLAFAGIIPPPARTGATEKWNGTSWTETGDIPSGYYNNRGLGTSSESAISIGGVNDPGSGLSKRADAYEFSGTSWSEITEMSTVRESGGTSSTAPTALALAFGGESPSLTVKNEEWNGSSWTEKGDMNTAKGDFGFCGTSTQSLAFGGSTPASPPYQQAICEFWNGSTWTEIADLSTGVANGIAPAGNAAEALSSGGLTGPTTLSTGTEEFTAPATLSTVTVS